MDEQIQETPEVSGENPAPTSETPAEFEFNDEVYNQIPEAFRDHVRGLVDTKTKYSELTGQLGDHKLEDLLGASETLQHYDAYCEKHNISPSIHNTFLENMAVFSEDPAKGAELLSQMLSDMRIQAGLELFPDLAERVNAGKLAEEDAVALHKARLMTQNYEAQMTQSQKAQEEQKQQQAKDALTNAFSTHLGKTEFKDNERAIGILGNIIGSWARNNNFNYTPDQFAQVFNKALEDLRGLTPPPAPAPQPQQNLSYQEDPFYKYATPEQKEILDRINRK